MKVSEHWITYEGSKIRYWTCGNTNNEALIFFHGWPGYLLLESNVVQELAKHFFVIAPQHPGLGKSDPLPSYHNIFEQNAGVAMQILKKESRDHDKVIVMGQSFGGPVASAFTHLYPKKTKALIMIDSLMGGKLMINIFSLWVYFWLYGGPKIARLGIYLPKFILKVLAWEGMGLKMENPQDWKRFYQSVPKRIALIENYAKRLHESFQIKKALIDKQYDDFPVIMLWGDRDGKEFSRYGSCHVDLARALAEKMSRYNKKLKFITVSGGHTILYDKPRYVIDEMLKCL